MANYDLDITDAQDSIITKLEALGYPVIIAGLPDASPPPAGMYTSGAIKPFLSVFFGRLKSTTGRRSRSLVDYRLDSYTTGFDVLAISHDPDLNRKMMNRLNNVMLGFKPTRGGGLHKGQAGFEGMLTVMDSNNRPSRWVTTDRFEFVPFAQKIDPSV